ncbi:MAG: hypothetical protein B7Y56_11720 [Gallionellales bacterium 35-53-114]|jgi:ubiquinone biosynthesis monooxygenase Coq7|nr:MAG: hypothetical protein B7Y56_11720 [Gallionellales bacterium 35-53-114]OYZ64729.1 MAG: hypothetical protein B7Y04_02880 [Gallionellales bacterium 24-53-125]OZB07733.1 MAG: hypothetical protein B7X61_14135 [Gallionellales bacterium 39-52-133]HQS58563.1 demethoxyubiquinone hydroxylase family protein [Gallionellaceae bacterium]HQS74904.1 demethoxyubiquinone hydroxylase family protein [Gallionellaceae bacterium]
MSYKAEEIERQLRIIHACEKGATGVYYGHRALAKVFFPRIIPDLDEMHAHESEHFEIFGALINSRGSRKATLPIMWCAGGIVYGLFIALFGVNSIWVSTATIEKIVSTELNLAAKFFKENDNVIYSAVQKIKLDEEHHHEIASSRAIFTGILPNLIQISSTKLSYLAKYLAARV